MTLQKLLIQFSASRAEMRDHNALDVGNAFTTVGPNAACNIELPLDVEVLLAAERLIFSEVGMVSLTFLDDRLLTANLLLGTAHVHSLEMIQNVKGVVNVFSGGEWVACSIPPASVNEIEANIQALKSSTRYDRQIAVWKNYGAGVTAILKLLIITQNLSHAADARFRLLLCLETND